MLLPNIFFLFFIVSLRNSLAPNVSRPLSPYDVPRMLPANALSSNEPVLFSALTSPKMPICPPRTPILGMPSFVSLFFIFLFSSSLLKKILCLISQVV